MKKDHSMVFLRFQKDFFERLFFEVFFATFANNDPGFVLFHGLKGH